MTSKYKKMDPIEHVLKRADVYIGSTRPRDVEDFIVVDEEFHIEKKMVNISPAILRIFIEPLANMIDNVERSRNEGVKMTKMAIDIKDTGEIIFWNDGSVIPIELHPEEKCYNHSLIFGQLLTSSNYDDDEKRVTLGKNGLGSKCSNIFSTVFTVEGVDPIRKKMFKQVWKNNMKEASEPIVTPSKLKGYTSVSFIPDFTRFGLEGFTDDIISVYKKYAVDTAMTTKIPMFFNGQKIPVTNLNDYASLYPGTEPGENLYIKTGDCEVFLTPSSEHEIISFCNGGYTPLGGTHVDAWSEAIFRPLLQKLNKPKKPQLNITDIKRFFRLFVLATVDKPEFDSQSKLKLESPAIQAEVKKSHIQTISRWSVMEKLEDIIRAKEMVVLKKSERKKRGHEKVEGLDPANNEGGKYGRECTLILVEGLSAKTYATCGIQRGVFGKQGRDFNGIFALRGKILNTRNATPALVARNAIVTDIIKAIGLQYGLDYTLEENYQKLRYGRVLLVTDADVDGFHISGLIQNLFHSLFPSLLKREKPFLTAMQTPIVRVYHGRNDILFYDEREYRKYVSDNPNKKINKKYYKGLGASSEIEVLETFGQKIIEFREDEKTFDTMNKVFHTKHANQRKSWLEQYDPKKVVLKWTGNQEEIVKLTYSDFLDTELIKFSIADCARSIPSLLDGLKEGHRKVLYVCFSRNLRYTGKVLKVAQLAGSVAEKSGYHHGEQNLFNTITGMACSYVGSNNIPLLFRDGQFGSRIQGGKDAPNARYINTKLDMLTRLIFRPEDDVLLEHVEDDGEQVEPRFYIPIIPMILVNGNIGIGTGWSSSVPCYNPLDLIECIKVWLENDGKVVTQDGETTISLFPEIKPWYRQHTGEMVLDSDQKYTSWGKLERDKNKVRVTELPVGLWTDDFKDFLEELREEKQITNYKNNSTVNTIDFTITEATDGVVCDETNLKLYKYIRTSNMVLFSESGQLKKYTSVDDIINEFCQVRFAFYIKRKKHILNNIENEIKFLGNKKRFLEEVRDGEIKLFEQGKQTRQSRKTADLVAELEKRGYDKMVEGEEKEEKEDAEENEDELKKPAESKKHGYDYLLRLQIHSFTAEKIDKLKNDIANRVDERDKLKGTSEKQLWLADLEVFEKEYKKYLDVLVKESAKVKNKKITK